VISPPQDGTTYRAFVDPSGGEKDSMVLVIGHRMEQVRVVDLIVEVKPPFLGNQVVADFANHCKAYGVTTVTGDYYGGQYVTELFEDNGILYERCALSKSKLYLEMVGMITSQTVELPDNETLFQQLVSLERTTGRSGNDSVTHVRGGHDDVVNGVAGMFSLLPVETSFFLGNWGGESVRYRRETP